MDSASLERYSVVSPAAAGKAADKKAAGAAKAEEEAAEAAIMEEEAIVVQWETPRFRSHLIMICDGERCERAAEQPSTTEDERRQADDESGIG